MTTTPTIKLDKPIASAAIVPGHSAFATTGDAVNPATEHNAESMAALEQMDMYVQQIQHCCTALQQAVNQVNGTYEEIIGSHQEAIARLSVEIARKILAQTIQDGDYQIQAIIQEALKNAPDSQDIVIRLHSNDLSTLEQLRADDTTLFEGVKLVEDHTVGPCECIVETPKGIVPYRIEEHLEKIEKALAHTG